MNQENKCLNDCGDIYNVMRELVDNGVSCFPLSMGSKKPQKNFKWDVYTTRLPTDDEIDRWEQLYKMANIAIITGSISNLVVVDIDGQSGEDFIGKNNWNESQYCVNTKKGRHLYYAIPEGKTCPRMIRPFGKNVDIDVLGDGGYVVAPPSFVAGYRYKLATTISIDELPIFDNSILSAHNNNVIPLKTSFKPRQSSEWDNVINGIALKDKPRHDSLLSLAGHYASSKLSEDSARLLLNIAVDNFNVKSPKEARKLTTKEADDCIDYAYKHESLKPAKRSLSDPAFVDALKAVKHEDKITYTPSKITVKPPIFPQAIIDNMGGIMGQIYEDYYKGTTTSPRPALAIPAICVGLANICGYRIKTPLPTPEYPTQAVLLLAPSGAGKDIPFRLPDRMAKAAFGSLEQAEYKDQLADEKDKEVNPLGMPECASAITSAESLEYALKNSYSKRILLSLDEFHAYACAMSSKNGGNYTTFTKIVNQLLTREEDYTKFAADASKSFSIPFWRLNMIAASATGKFWNAIDPNTASDGLFGRLEIWEDFTTPECIDDPIDEAEIAFNTITPDQFPEHVLMTLRNMADEPLIKPEIGNNSAAIYICTRESRIFLNKIKHEFFDRSNEMDPNEQIAASSLYNRARQHIIKKALLHHESLCWERGSYEPRPAIEIESFQWGYDVMSYVMKNIVTRMNNDMGDTAYAKNLFRVKKNIKKRMQKGLAATNKSISNSLNLTGKEFKDILEGLVRGEQIDVTAETINGKEVLSYVLTEEGLNTTV